MAGEAVEGALPVASLLDVPPGLAGLGRFAVAGVADVGQDGVHPVAPGQRQADLVGDRPVATEALLAEVVGDADGRGVTFVGRPVCRARVVADPEGRQVGRDGIQVLRSGRVADHDLELVAGQVAKEDGAAGASQHCHVGTGEVGDGVGVDTVDGK